MRGSRAVSIIEVGIGLLGLAYSGIWLIAMCGIAAWTIGSNQQPLDLWGFLWVGHLVLTALVSLSSILAGFGGILDRSVPKWFTLAVAMGWLLLVSYWTAYWSWISWSGLLPENVATIPPRMIVGILAIWQIFLLRKSWVGRTARSEGSRPV